MHFQNKTFQYRHGHVPQKQNANDGRKDHSVRVRDGGGPLLN